VPVSLGDGRLGWRAVAWLRYCGGQAAPAPTTEGRRRCDAAALRVEALNHALRGIVDLILSVPAGCYSIEAANPRHEHDLILSA
jgi:hypothetical protein